MSNRARWTQEQLDAYLEQQGAEGAKAVLNVTQPDKRDEKQLQGECEAWLEAIGYRRRTPREIQRHHLGLWYVHLHKTKANPILLDLLLIDATYGPYSVRAMEIELKVEGGKLTPEQRCLTIRNEGVVCWSLREFQDVVRKWRTNEGKGK